MGVLRIKDDVEDLLEKDPYALFTLEEPHRMARRMRPELWWAASVGLLFAFGVALAAFLHVRSGTSEAGDLPHAYFEIKVIDPDGRPVAGASVKEADKALGVTDSFGEWRRFMRVQLGSTVALTIAKRGPEGSLTAVKNIAVPPTLPSAGDLELTGSVQLARGGSRGVPVSRDRVPTRQASASVEASGEDPLSSVSSISPASSVAAATAEVPRSIWFMADAAARPELQEVVQALRKRSLELGVRVDPASPWRVKVTDILVARKTEARPERRLLQIDARRVDQAEEIRLFAYLRDYQDTAIKTARDVLWAATMHVPLTYPVTPGPDGNLLLSNAGMPALWALAPGRLVVDQAGRTHSVVPVAGGLTVEPPLACEGSTCTVSTPGIASRPPVFGWARRQARLAGLAPEADVFVAGYEARRVDGETIEFWGPSDAGVNVTVIQGGRLVRRTRLEPGAITMASPGTRAGGVGTTTL